MSKISHQVLPIFATFLLILQFFTFSSAQDLDVSIKVRAERPGIAEVRGTFSTNASAAEFWFLGQYPGSTSILTDRLSVVYFYDKHGYLIGRKKASAGEVFNSRNIGGFAYSASLEPGSGGFGSSHVSWLTDTEGLILLDDLLPQSAGRQARVAFELPTGWNVYSAEEQASPVSFRVTDIDKAAFYLGSRARGIDRPQLRVAISGEWHFSDKECVDMATDVFGEIAKMLGRSAGPRPMLVLSKFPGFTPIGNWEADTRGGQITILSSDMPFKSQSLQRLHEQLRHEIFHLWFPNGVNLTGKYDWFYEGFALYQSLKLGVAVNRIRFDDYLDTLSRAYAIDRASQGMSLIEASKQRWSGLDTTVYARGMLVAFLCDLAMLDATKGKRSSNDLLRELFAKHKSAATPQDANSVILAMMREKRELGAIADRYVNGSERIDLASYVNLAGIEVTGGGPAERLIVVQKPSGRQKDLLDKLGYNNWRKLAGGN